MIRTPPHELLVPIALAMVLAAPAAPAAAAADRVQAEIRVDPRVVRPGGTVRLTFRVEGDGLRWPEMRPRFELENLRIAGGPQKSSGVRLGTGGGRWYCTWSWFLRPRNPGSAAVTSIRLEVDGRELQLPPRRIRVVPGGPPGIPPTPRTGPNGRDPDARDPGARGDRDGDRRPGTRYAADAPEIFLRAEVEPSRPYVGQRTVYTASLFTRVNVDRIEAAGVPTFEGCWSRPVDLSRRGGERVRVDGVPYTRKALYERELYPLRAGTFEVGTLGADLVIERIERERLFRAPVRVSERVHRESNPVELTVRPLPEPSEDLGARFTGAVGPFEVDARLEASEVPVGHAATLTVSVSGAGHLEGLRPPPIRVPEEVEILGPRNALGTTRTGGPGGAAQGRREEPIARRAWSYLLVPHRVGTWPLPPVEIAYFDPESGRYRTARAELPDLVTRPAGSSGESTDLASATGAGEGTLHPIRSAALPVPGSTRWRSLLPWAFGVPWLLALALLLARRSGVARALGRAIGRTPRGPGGHALRRLHEHLESALEEERPRRAAAAFERGWRHFLTDALGVPETTPVSAWPDVLRRSGTAPGSAERLAELLEELHYLRFAPELSDVESLAGELAERSERLARELLR